MRLMSDRGYHPDSVTVRTYAPGTGRGFAIRLLLNLVFILVQPWVTAVAGAEGNPMKDNVFTPCPGTPNCVSSMESGTSHYLSPLRYEGTAETARKRLIEVIQGFKRTQIVEDRDVYVRATFTSFLFGFVDDVEFLFDDNEKMIHVKSASRSGSYDFGVNRRRCETIRQRFRR